MSSHMDQLLVHSRAVHTTRKEWIYQRHVRLWNTVSLAVFMEIQFVFQCTKVINKVTKK